MSKNKFDLEEITTVFSAVASKTEFESKISNYPLYTKLLT